MRSCSRATMLPQTAGLWVPQLIAIAVLSWPLVPMGFFLGGMITLVGTNLFVAAGVRKAG